MASGQIELDIVVYGTENSVAPAIPKLAEITTGSSSGSACMSTHETYCASGEVLDLTGVSFPTGLAEGKRRRAKRAK